MTDIKFDTTPGAGILKAMSNEKWTIHGAVAELIDNSFGKARGDAAKCEITWTPKTRTLSVLDHGRGMDKIGLLFKLGSGANLNPDDIGRYGAGGTKALLWLATEVRIWTMRDGMVMFDSVDWDKQKREDEFPQVSDTWKPARVTNTPMELFTAGHGTLIRIKLAPVRKGWSIEHAKQELSAIYAPAFRHGKELTWTTQAPKDNVTRTLAEPPDRFEQAPVQVNASITLSDGRQLGARGVIGLIPGLSAAKSKIAVGFGSRVIDRTDDCYNTADSARYSGRGVTGYLDLVGDWQEFLSTTKDTVNDRPVWDALMAEVFTQIEPVLELAKQESIQKVILNISIGLKLIMANMRHLIVASSPDGTAGGPGDASGGARGSDGTATRTPGGGRKPGTRGGDGGGDNTEADAPGAAEIEVQQLADGVDGLMATTKLNPNGILVTVNSDSPYVQTMIHGDTVFTREFNAFVLRDIAQAFVDEPEYVAMAFPSGVVHKFNNDYDDPDDSANRGRFLHQVLMTCLQQPTDG